MSDDENILDNPEGMGAMSCGCLGAVITVFFISLCFSMNFAYDWGKVLNQDVLNCINCSICLAGAICPLLTSTICFGFGRWFMNFEVPGSEKGAPLD